MLKIIAAVLVLLGVMSETPSQAQARRQSRERRLVAGPGPDWSPSLLVREQLPDLERRFVEIPEATHLMHLETGRHDLYAEVNAFLAGRPPVAAKH